MLYLRGSTTVGYFDHTCFDQQSNNSGKRTGLAGKFACGLSTPVPWNDDRIWDIFSVLYPLLLKNLIIRISDRQFCQETLKIQQTVVKEKKIYSNAQNLTSSNELEKNPKIKAQNKMQLRIKNKTLNKIKTEKYKKKIRAKTSKTHKKRIKKVQFNYSSFVLTFVFAERRTEGR